MLLTSHEALMKSSTSSTSIAPKRNISGMATEVSDPSQHMDCDALLDTTKLSQYDREKLRVCIEHVPKTTVAWKLQQAKQPFMEAVLGDGSERELSVLMRQCGASVEACIPCRCVRYVAARMQHAKQNDIPSHADLSTFSATGAALCSYLTSALCWS